MAKDQDPAALDAGKDEPLDAPIEVATVDLEKVDLKPHFIKRLTDPQIHAGYLETFHENVYRNLSVIHLLMAKGRNEDAISKMKQLRDQCDVIWGQRVAAAQQGRPA